jgi:TolB-like protein
MKPERGGVRAGRLGVALLVAALAGASRAEDAERVVLPGVVGLTEAQQQVAASLDRALRFELRRTADLETIAPQDLALLLTPEQRANVAACAPDADACVTEATASTGAAWVLAGHVVGRGGGLHVELRLLRARDGKVVWRNGTELGAATDVTRRIVAAVRAALATEGLTAKASDVAAVEPPAGAEVWSPLLAQVTATGVAKVATLVAGTTALVFGVAFSVGAAQAWSNLHDTAWRNATPWQGIQAETATFNRDIWLGAGLAAVGVAVVAGGVLWTVPGNGSGQPPVSASLTPAGLEVGGTW